MSDAFGSDFFKANRDRLRQLFTGTAPIAIAANGLLQKTSDEAYDFHQDSNFWYLTGIDDPDVVLVMDKGREYLILPERTAWMDVSEGEIKPEELTRRSGIDEVLKQKEGWRQFGARLKRVQHVATLSANPPFMDVFGMYANPARAALIKRLKDANQNLELLDLRQHLRRMRMVKQPAELEALRRAIDVTVETLKYVTRPSNLARYAYDAELEADISHQFRRRGAQDHAFSPVVTSGPRACVLHNKAANVLLASDELVVIDVGAKIDYYCADITRTISLNGKPSRRQQAVHKAVEQAQDYAYSLIKPGLAMAEYEKNIAQFVGEKLRELGVIKSIDDQRVRKYFPHATSHFLGLDAHDAGDYDHPLEPGTVLTVEPGIYIPEEGIGVRIEDDLLITDTGYEILSRDLPREL